MIHCPAARRAHRAVPRARSLHGKRGWSALLILVLSFAVYLPLWLTSPAAAATRTVELAPSAMSHTNLGWPFGNYADAPHLALSHTRYATYLIYDTSAIAADMAVVSAELVVQVGESEADTHGLVARYSESDWSAQSLRYADRPRALSPVISGREDRPLSSGAQVTLPLTDTFAIRPSGRVGLQLGFAEGNEEIQLSKAQPPTLRLTLKPTTRRQRPASAKLPYAMAPIETSEKKVFAHYMPPYPISLDDEDPKRDYYSRNYLSPRGENGKFRSVGGLLRDRPLPRAPIGAGYELVDATKEVEQASAAGIDGFTMNILDWSGSLWDRSLLMAEAADQDDQGFVVVPNLDLASNADNEPIDYIASRLAEFYNSPAAYRLPDRRYVLSSFKAEERSAGWWASLLSELEERHGIKIALVAVLLDASEDNLKEFAPISYALSTWGLRSSTSIMDAPDHARIAHRAGVKWMAPVAVQDVRHHKLVYAEAGNTETLRASWSRALADKADLVQLVTWNDYSESTHFAPSQAHGSGFLDVNGYFLTQFKTGRQPAITGDQLVVSHRIQKHGTEPTVQRSRMAPTLSGVKVKPRNTVEVLAMLKAPASITVRTGSSSSTFSAPAGLSSIVVPLQEGVVAARASRGGQDVAEVTSPHKVVGSLPHYDLQYYAASSRKDD